MLGWSYITEKRRNHGEDCGMFGSLLFLSLDGTTPPQRRRPNKQIFLGWCNDDSFVIILRNCSMTEISYYEKHFNIRMNCPERIDQSSRGFPCYDYIVITLS